jgi:hypothetical protein
MMHENKISSFLFFLLRDKVSLCAKADKLLGSSDPPASASCVAEMKASTTPSKVSSQLEEMTIHLKQHFKERSQKRKFKSYEINR